MLLARQGAARSDGGMTRMALVLPVLLAGCIFDEAPAPEPVATPDAAAEAAQCPAPELQHLVGEPASAAESYEYDGPVRIIRPGMMVTMDFVPTRLNFEIGEDGLIARVWCG